MKMNRYEDDEYFIWRFVVWRNIYCYKVWMRHEIQYKEKMDTPVIDFFSYQ